MASTVLMAVLAAAPLAAVWTVARVGAHLERTRILNGPAKVVERVQALAASGTQWPWQWYWPNGEMPEVVRYLTACTTPSDRVLLTWFAPEYYFFSQRGFASGHAQFSSAAAFATTRDNRKMVMRMQQEQVPLVFRNESTAASFATAYPALTDFIDANYQWFDSFRLRDGSVVRMGVRRNLQPRRQYGESRWPCGFGGEAEPIAKSNL